MQKNWYRKIHTFFHMYRDIIKIFFVSLDFPSENLATRFRGKTMNNITKSLLSCSTPHSLKNIIPIKLSRSIYETTFALLLHPFINSNRIESSNSSIFCQKIDSFITFPYYNQLNWLNWLIVARVNFAKEIYRAHETKRFQFIVTAPWRIGELVKTPVTVSVY